MTIAEGRSRRLTIVIPRILHQFWCNLTLPDHPPGDVAAVIEITRQRTMGWQHHLWNSQSIEEMLRKYPDYLKVFQVINIPAMKSDLARVLVLHEIGGLYLDAACVPRFANSAEKFIADGDPRCVVAESMKDSSVLMNRIIATEARNPYIRRVLEGSFRAVAASITAGDTSIDVWSLTGSKLTKIIRESGSLKNGVRVWAFEEAFAHFTRETCEYKEDPLGQWATLQKGEILPVYRY